MPRIPRRDECEAVVRTTGWLARQPEAFQSALLKRAKLRAVAAEETIHLPGAEPGGMFGIVSGSFRAHVSGRGSSYVLAHILRAGLWFGHGPLNTGRARTLGFVAAEPSIVFHIPLAALAQWASSDVLAARCLASLTEYSMDVTIATVADLLIPASDKRIAAVLLRVTGAAVADPGETPIAYRLTQAQLGEMANASRDLVNRTLRSFETRGWLTLGYNQIVVTNAAALSNFVSQ